MTMTSPNAMGHILRKDMILLWPLAGLSVLAQACLAALMAASDAQPQLQMLALAARLAVAVVFLAIVFGTAFAVHQEPILGTRQDWLVRPIRRLDLFGAKLLFVLLVVHLPMLVFDIVGAMAHGFSLGEAIGPALARDLNVLLTLTLPALGFAALTANTAQFLMAGLAYVVAMVAGTVLLSLTVRMDGQEQATNPLFWTGVAWIPQTIEHAVLAAGAMAALALLYARRKAALAWTVFLLFAFVSALAVLLPWGAIFAVQETASAAPAGLTVQADLSAPRYRLPAGEKADAYGVGAAQVQLRGRAAGDIAIENQARKAQGDVTVYAPLRITGLPMGAILWADRATVRLTDSSGRMVFQGRGDWLKLDPSVPGAGYEAIRVPALVFEAQKDRPLTLQVDYSLSVLAARPALSIPALGADLRLEGLGRCATGRDSDGDEIELRCTRPGLTPSCLSTTLEDPASGRRNPETLLCSPDYAPYAVKPFPDALGRFEVETPFRDRLGLASYPVGAAQLGSARVRITPYASAGHLSRQVTAKDLRLSAWTAG